MSSILTAGWAGCRLAQTVSRRERGGQGRVARPAGVRDPGRRPPDLRRIRSEPRADGAGDGNHPTEEARPAHRDLAEPAAVGPPGRGWAVAEAEFGFLGFQYDDGFVV